MNNRVMMNQSEVQVSSWLLAGYKRFYSCFVGLIGFCLSTLVMADEFPADIAWWQMATPAQVQRLLAEGTDIDARSGSGMTLLHWAAEWSDDADIVSLLLSAGADVNALNLHSAAPLHSATFDEINPDIIWVLLEAGADVNARESDGFTPLHTFILTGKPLHSDVIWLLNEYGADVNAVSDHGLTPMLAALERRDVQILQTLLQLGARMPDYPRVGNNL